MSVINTNINALTGLSNLRRTNAGIKNSLEKLSSGYQINKAADDPSGLAIAVGMRAQNRGMDVAVQNAQDTINMIQTADGALEETNQILQRMRDISVRGANQAAGSVYDQQKLYQEYMSLACEFVRKADAVTFNTKNLLHNMDFDQLGAGSGLPEQVTQIGADNGTSMRMDITITNMVDKTYPMGGIPLSMTAFVNFAPGAYIPQDGTGMEWVGAGPPPDVSSGFQNLIDFTDAVIKDVAQTRASLGVRQRRLDRIINDLDIQNLNISSARSRIIDVNMATEITQFTKSQILQQSGTAILAQANAQPQSVLQLLQ